jgi:hypothetical protein
MTEPTDLAPTLLRACRHLRHLVAHEGCGVTLGCDHPVTSTPGTLAPYGMWATATPARYVAGAET